MYTIKVAYYYKGKNLQKIFKVRSGVGGGDCGYAFDVGKTYLIFAYQEKPNKFVTNHCTRTRTIKKAKGIIKKLDKLLTKKYP